MDYDAYIKQFSTKQELETELKRVQRNMDNTKPIRYHFLLWEKKRRLLDEIKRRMYE